jgi:hypothetical protein
MTFCVERVEKLNGGFSGYEISAAKQQKIAKLLAKNWQNSEDKEKQLKVRIKLI